MSASESDRRRPAPRGVMAAMTVVAVAITWWLLSHAFISDNARECHRRYAAARNAADTAAVDRHVPDPGAATSTARTSCGGMRGNARW